MNTLLLVAILGFAGTGCSAHMALQGRPEPDVSGLKVGAHREQILKVLREPALTYKGAQGGVDLFHVPSGLESDPGRAMAWAGLDVLTLGLWELVGSAVESNQGSSLNFAVGYDEGGTVINVLASDRWEHLRPRGEMTARSEHER